MIQFFKFWPFVRQNQPHFEFLGHPGSGQLSRRSFQSSRCMFFLSGLILWWPSPLPPGGSWFSVLRMLTSLISLLNKYLEVISCVLKISAFDCPKVNPGHKLEKSPTVILKYVLDSSYTKFLESGQPTWKRKVFSFSIYPLPPLAL